MCPNWRKENKCDDGFYWNELACTCFSLTSDCKCPKGQYNQPNKDCDCALKKQEYLDLFPKWVTAKDISVSIRDGMLRAETNMEKLLL